MQTSDAQHQAKQAKREENISRKKSRHMVGADAKKEARREGGGGGEGAGGGTRPGFEGRKTGFLNNSRSQGHGKKDSSSAVLDSKPSRV